MFLFQKNYIFPRIQRGSIFSREGGPNANFYIKVSKGAKIRNRYIQVPHLTQDTYGKVINSVRHHKREPRGQPFPSRKPI